MFSKKAPWRVSIGLVIHLMTTSQDSGEIVLLYRFRSESSDYMKLTAAETLRSSLGSPTTDSIFRCLEGPDSDRICGFYLSSMILVAV